MVQSTPRLAGLSLALALAILAPISHGADAPPPAAAFGRVSDFSSGSLTPDGATIAYGRATPSGDKIVMSRVGSTQPLRVADLGEGTILRDLVWADNDTVLATVSSIIKVPGAPSVQANWHMTRVMALDTSGGSPRMLLLDDPRLVRNTGSRLLPVNPQRAGSVTMEAFDHPPKNSRPAAGSRIARSGSGPDWVSTIFDVDVATGEGRVVEYGSGDTLDWLVDPAGKPVARRDWRSEIQECTILVEDNADWRSVYRNIGPECLHLAGLTPGRDAIVATGENGTDRSRIWAIPRDGSAPKVLFEDPVADADYAITDDATGLVLGYMVYGIHPQVHWIDPTMDATQRAMDKAFPGRRAWISSTSADKRKLLVNVESGQDPKVLYFVDLDAHRADIVGEAFPGLAGAALGQVRAFTYPSRDGTSIPAFLTLPPDLDEKKLPLVVLVHDGPADVDMPGFDWWAQFLATRGYAVLQPQFRGSLGFGRAFRLAGYQQWGGLMQDDVTDGVRHLIADGIADPRRVCIMGLGYGGFAALAGAALTPDTYVCAVSVNGISDLPAYIDDDLRRHGQSDAQLAWFARSIGSPKDPRLAQVSPARIPQNIRIPILLIHGSKDTTVFPRQSEIMAKALKAAGKQYEIIKLPDSGHWPLTSESRTKMLESIEAFLAQHL